jgi:hypothetical protein
MQLTNMQSRSFTTGGEGSNAQGAASETLQRLAEAWDECMPGQISIQPEQAALECLVMLLECILMVLQSLHPSGVAQIMSAEARYLQHC